MLIIFISLIGCVKSRKNEASPTAVSAIEDLKFDEIDHDSLTVKQLKDIKRIHYVFSEVSSSSMEEMINKFKRDKHPDEKIVTWSKMAAAYERFTLNKHVEEYDKKVEAYQLILLRSTMAEEDVLGKVDIIHLTKEEVNEVFSYCATLPESTKIEQR
ncbi:MAG TPA: hypothetical protein VK658_21385 [Chryseolinea sp.]|nr:hypothetical protein [Chryseolinea sp.]